MKYDKKINNVIDYIAQHLDTPMTTKTLALVAGLSDYHFHRIFRAEIGETLAQYILRQRLEKAGRQLMRDDDTLISEIAYSCGFGTAALFCRNFKRHFGLTPIEYRSKMRQQNSKNRLSLRKNETVPYAYTDYLCSRKTLQLKSKIMNCTFEIKHLESKQVIYARHRGAYNEMGEAFERIVKWGYARGLVKGAPQLGSVYLDDPTITPMEKLQSDAFLVVDQDVKVEGEIGKYTIPAGKYAVGRFEIAMAEFGEAWSSMCPLIADSGLVSVDGFHYEMYLNNFAEHPEKKFIVDICIPVKPAV